jgi:hypothetical protein
MTGPVLYHQLPIREIARISLARDWRTKTWRRHIMIMQSKIYFIPKGKFGGVGALDRD